jgi:hypothetical protein
MGLLPAAAESAAIAATALGPKVLEAIRARAASMSTARILRSRGWCRARSDGPLELVPLHVLKL